MTSQKRLKELTEARKKQKEAREQLIRKGRTNRSKSTTQSPKIPSKPKEKSPEELAPKSSHKQKLQRPSKPWGKLQSGFTDLKLFSRTDNTQELQPQPWTHKLVDIMLETADEGGVYICFAWPVYLTDLALLHSLANIERNFASDLRGMRTLFYPGTYATRTVLQSALASRDSISDLYRSLWTNKGDGYNIESFSRSDSFEAMLNALNDIRNYHPEVENPSLGELAPTFIYEHEQRTWASVAKFPLERSLKKIDKLAHRRNIRERVNAEWGDPKKAPSALMVLHHRATKNVWKDALSDQALELDSRPEIFLLDATSSKIRTNYHSTKRIPGFLKYAFDNGYENTGAIIVTDDPKTFFTLKRQLKDLKLDPKIRVWAAESADSILSNHPLPRNWKPTQKSNTNFRISIVDRDASQVGIAFQRLAREVGDEESPNYKTLMEACLYIMRLSNMPAGYTDLTAQSAESGVDDFATQKNAWTPLKLSLQVTLQSGALNAKRAEADRAIFKAEQLIDAWADATPMALRLLYEVQKHAVDNGNSLSIILPNNKYIQLAYRFLERKLGDRWVACKKNLNWHTLSSISKTLKNDHEISHFVFLGINRTVLRLLITNPDIPHGTAVLVAYKQAASILTTLASMKTIEAFKPYRGRMGLLTQQLEQRIKEIPNPPDIDKLGDMTMVFRIGNETKTDTETDQSYYKFELDGGSPVYASSWLYRYEPDEDPFFRRVAASSIQQGDFVFDMSEELRSKLESLLQINRDGLTSEAYPGLALLKLYHDDIKIRCELFFKGKTRRVLAREIHDKMIEINSEAVECRQGRIYYWLSLQKEGDTRPHAPRDANFFETFCSALQIDKSSALNYWSYIRNARRISQNLGRQLSALYTEILFHPESAAIYRKIPELIIKQLQKEALSCVYRIDQVIPPQNHETT